MHFLLRLIQTFLDKWFIPIAAGAVIVLLTDKGKQSIVKRIVPFIIVVIVSTLLLTLSADAPGSKVDESSQNTEEGTSINNLEPTIEVQPESESTDPDPQMDIFLSDNKYTWGVRGLASMYDDNPIPIWFESDLDDPRLTFEIDNIGSSYANVVKTKLIIDNFEPVTMDELLLLREESHAGVPWKAKADVNLSNIESGRSEYDVNFTVYGINQYGVREETGIYLEKGDTFYVEQSSRAQLITFLQLNKTGIYTYHLNVEFEYYKKTVTMETEPYSFVYIADDVSIYRFNKEKLDSFHIAKEYSNENGSLYFDIDGRTLRIHDTEIVLNNSYIQEYFSLINTIVFEDGTIDVEPFALGDEPGLPYITTVYLPVSLRHISLHALNCFGRLEKIYYGGTEEQWNSLIQSPEYITKYKMEDVDIVYNYGAMPTKDEEFMMHQNNESYYLLDVEH